MKDAATQFPSVNCAVHKTDTRSTEISRTGIWLAFKKLNSSWLRSRVAIIVQAISTRAGGRAGGGRPKKWINIYTQSHSAPCERVACGTHENVIFSHRLPSSRAHLLILFTLVRPRAKNFNASQSGQPGVASLTYLAMVIS